LLVLAGAGCRRDAPPPSPTIEARHGAVPEAARQRLIQIHAAAARRDLAALRALMDPAFTWSFGGDTDADQAIEAWRQDPSRLGALQRALEQGRCEPDGRYLTCEDAPSATGRLVLRQDGGQWIWEAFVEGD
jgi:hypothetical protein